MDFFQNSVEMSASNALRFKFDQRSWVKGNARCEWLFQDYMADRKVMPRILGSMSEA